MWLGIIIPGGKAATDRCRVNTTDVTGKMRATKMRQNKYLSKRAGASVQMHATKTLSATSGPGLHRPVEIVTPSIATSSREGRMAKNQK